MRSCRPSRVSDVLKHTVAGPVLRSCWHIRSLKGPAAGYIENIHIFCKQLQYRERAVPSLVAFPPPPVKSIGTAVAALSMDALRLRGFEQRKHCDYERVSGRWKHYGYVWARAVDLRLHTSESASLFHFPMSSTCEQKYAIFSRGKPLATEEAPNGYRRPSWPT